MWLHTAFFQLECKISVVHKLAYKMGADLSGTLYNTTKHILSYSTFNDKNLDRMNLDISFSKTGLVYTNRL